MYDSVVGDRDKEVSRIFAGRAVHLVKADSENVDPDAGEVRKSMRLLG